MTLADFNTLKEKIINDTEYLNWMDRISLIEREFANSSEFNNSIALDHGIKHMQRVAKNTYDLMHDYGCDNNLCLLGYIVGLIHDIGIIHGKKNHAEKGANMCPDFLRKFSILNEDEIYLIKEAILTHGDGVTQNIIGLFLALTDKIDMCKSRSLANTSPIKEIKNYKSTIDNHTLKINYEMSSLKGIEGLYIIPKSIDVPTSIAKELKLNIEFYINGKLEDFASRKYYKGEIYK